MRPVKYAYLPSVPEVEAARLEFLDREPRTLFYKAARELVELALKRKTAISVGEALAVLLQTWNAAYYRFRDRFSEQHLKDIEELLLVNSSEILHFKGRRLESMVDEDVPRVLFLFGTFERILGTVGAAKGLHLLAPDFFPLWDRTIAAEYACQLDSVNSCKNSAHYIRFMRSASDQCRNLAATGAPWNDLLKALDEYNYCKFTVPKLEEERRRRTTKRAAAAAS